MKNLHKLPMPKTNLQEVLFVLINQKYCSFFDFIYMQGFRTRISQIRKQINISTELLHKTNKFGNTYIYGMHKLPDTENQKALDLYYELWTNSK